MTTNDFNNAAESSIIGMASSFIINEFFQWGIHTIGTIVSGVIVSVVIFFFNKYLKQKFPN